MYTGLRICKNPDFMLKYKPAPKNAASTAGFQQSSRIKKIVCDINYSPKIKISLYIFIGMLYYEGVVQITV